MPMDKETAGWIGVFAFVTATTAIGMTEWHGAHPIRSFAESFVAVALLLSSFFIATVAGIKTKYRLDKSRRFCMASTFFGWVVGVACLLASIAVVVSVPGVSEALDRLPELDDEVLNGP